MAINHMHLAPRCTARSKRTGERCKAPAVRGWNVCRMHGAKGGAPKGERHGNFKHGAFSSDFKAEQRRAKALLAMSRETLSRIAVKEQQNMRQANDK